MRKTILAFALILTACMSHPPAAPPADAPRMAIDIKYVGVPAMQVYEDPSELAAIVTSVGYTETVSILSRRGDWAEIRLVEGSGWVHAADLIDVTAVNAILSDTTPRFFTPPVEVQDPKARGEIVLNANVNAGGEVVSVWTVQNTTGSKKLAEDNTLALQQAKFYPIVQKGQRMTFTYVYTVAY